MNKNNKMTKKFTALLLGVALASSTLCGCSVSDILGKAEIGTSRDNFDTSAYIDSVKQFISGDETSSKFVNTLKISEEDIITDAQINQQYFLGMSLYIQVNDTYMYRFQLNKNGLIESYIKYSLEA